MSKCCCLSRFVTGIEEFIILYFVSCLVSLDGLFQFALGSQESARWDAGSPGNNPTIGYSLGSKTVQVELVCSTDFPGNLDALGEDPPEFYKFSLTSKCCCPNGCQGKLF